MGILIFFGAAAIVLMTSTIYLTVVFVHHFKQTRYYKGLKIKDKESEKAHEVSP